MKYAQEETDYIDPDTDVAVSVSIVVRYPDEYEIDSRVLVDAAERATDLIFDEGINDSE